MKTKIVGVIVAIILGTFSAALAASDRCVVVKSEGKQLTLECRKNTEQFKAGAEIKIKTSRKAPIEGC